jgi:DinB superfamily
MNVAEVFLELYSRIPPLARDAAEGLDAAQLAATPAPGTNSIGWLVWHLARVQDHHIAELLNAPQLWAGGDWAGRFGLEPDPRNTGYGHSPADVAAVRPVDAAALIDYLDAVDVRTRSFLAGVRPDDLDGIVDRRWDPPVTLGMRLVSVADDCLQHAGQAAYVRGLLGP